MTHSLGELLTATSCTCAGDTVTYNCNIAGGGFTIWRGTAFDCSTSQNSILLRHSSFGSGGTMGTCNNGVIAGRSVGVSSDNSIYTSQLKIDLASSPNLVGRTVQCVYRNTQNVDITVGSVTIQLTGRANKIRILVFKL